MLIGAHQTEDYDLVLLLAEVLRCRFIDLLFSLGTAFRRDVMFLRVHVQLLFRSFCRFYKCSLLWLSALKKIESFFLKCYDFFLL